MQPTRQITVFFAFLAVLTVTGGLLLALEPEPLTPTQSAPVLVATTPEPASNPATTGVAATTATPTPAVRPNVVTTSVQ
ncbi:MAG: hypothetical protein AAF743_10600 [Planctomycetota bacterium]